MRTLARSPGFFTVAILSLGTRLAEALKAADTLDAKGLSTTVADLRFVIDCALDGRLPLIGKHVDRKRVGVAGHSFGGWTTLMMPPHTIALLRALDRP